MKNHQPATVVSLGDESFASGLLCVVTEALTTSAPVLLVTYDTALPEPLDELLPIHRHSAAAWVISDGARRDLPSLASLRLDLADAGDPTPLPAWLPASWRGNCSARAVAALALLDAPADHALHLGLNGRRLTLTRDDGGTA